MTALRYCLAFALAAALAVSMTACAVTDMIDSTFETDIGGKIAKEAYERVEDYCETRGDDLAGRADTLTRINAHAGPFGNGAPRAAALDCDGDGAPDVTDAPPT